MSNNFEQLKKRGNDLFRAKKFTDAIKLYTEAINIKDDEPVAYSNRAQCYINVKKYYDAEEDCSKAISLDPTSLKAYYRRSVARRELFKLEDSISDLKKVLSLDPSLEVAISDLRDLENAVSKDEKMEMPIMDKPEALRSKLPVKSFDLNNHYVGQKLYSH